MYFWQEFHHSNAMPFSGHHIGWYMMSMNVISENVNLDHLRKLVFASSLHCKVTTFPFVSDKYLVGKFLQSMYISCFSSYFQTLALASIGGPRLTTFTTVVFAKCWLFPNHPQYWQLEFHCKEEIASFSLLLFTYLFTPLGTHRTLTSYFRWELRLRAFRWGATNQGEGESGVSLDPPGSLTNTSSWEHKFVT
jgi:hypothetical protein